MKLRKKPVVPVELDAIQVTEDMLVTPSPIPGTIHFKKNQYLTLRASNESAFVGDWIVRGPRGLYIIRQDVAEEQYDVVP